MSKHAQRSGITRTLSLVALALGAALLRRPWCVRRLRDRLDESQRPELVRPPENHPPTRHRVVDDGTVWHEAVACAWRTVVSVWRRADVSRTAEVAVRWLRDVVRAQGARSGWTPRDWPQVRRTAWRRPAGTFPWHTGTSLGNLTGVVGVVLTVLLISGVVGQIGTAPTPQSAALAGSPAADSAESGGSDAKGMSRGRGSVRVQPYIYLNSNHLPDVGAVMRQTGVTEFTLAFILSNGGCRAVWDGGTHVEKHAGEMISAIRANGGDVVVSFGGWAGRKLGTHCRTPRALASAYQQVIDTYRLRAIDVDIEYHEFENPRAQDRVLRALRIVARANPGLTTIVTMPVAKDGLNSWGLRMVRRAVELRVPVDVWTVMPFVLGTPGGDMGRMTITAAERTHAQLASFYPGVPAADVYRKLGISSMNGDTGAGETITQADFREMRAYVHRRGLGRFTFWAVNRDMPCPSRGSRPCSGVPQRPWQFTEIVNGVPGGS